MASLCLSHQEASTGMQHELFRSLRDLNLRSTFDLDLSRSNRISFEASLREKQADAIVNSLSLFLPSLPVTLSVSSITNIIMCGGPSIE